jgi:hypothetical protein
MARATPPHNNELRVCERIKGLCGAKPPQKPRWTNAVVLGGWLEVVWDRGNLARVRGSAESARYVH